MAISVIIRKKYEDDTMAVYNYGRYREEIGEFSIQKNSLNIEHLRSTNEVIDQIMYLSATSKILKMIQNGEALPEITSYNA